MYQPLEELLERRPSKWTESDIKRALEAYLRKLCKTEKIYCEEVGDGKAVVRVGTPTLNQSVCLLTPEARAYLKNEANYQLKNIKVMTTP